MKKTLRILMLFVALFSAVKMNAQVTIGADREPQATLDVVASDTSSTTVPEGVIAPRLTGDQLQAKDPAYGSDQTGAIVYVTAAVSGTPAGKTVNVTAVGYYYFDGNVWQSLKGAGGGGSTYTGSTSITLNGASFERAALTGDVQADANNNTTTITAIRGKSVSATAPTAGQVLKWNGTTNVWEPATDDDTNTTYTFSSPLTTSGTTIGLTTGNLTAGTPSATATNPLVVGTGGNRLAGGGATVTANNTAPLWNANQLRGNNVSATVPTAGQVLKWNGTTNVWEPAADNDTNTTYTAVNGLTLNGTAFELGGTLTKNTNIGSNLLYLDNSNKRVGINNTAPNATLEVAATAAGNGSVAEGLIVPKLTLAQLNAKVGAYGTAQIGAWVYITSTAGGSTNAKTADIACTGFVYWNGEKWVANCAIEKWIRINTQPKAFTFYEEGTEMPVALEVVAAASSPITYQWYKITGSNKHVRVAEKCTSSDGDNFTTASFTPKKSIGTLSAVIKGTTKDAANTGFYKYFCVVKNAQGDSITSDIAEVAVGCGAKDLNGEWVSFMCYNLGATQRTINAQKTSPSISHPDYNSNPLYPGMYSYTPNEENLYGDLYQWGRIGDEHEKRNKISVQYNSLSAPVPTNGNTIGSATANYPWQQIPQDDITYGGRFIHGQNNWYPGTQNNADILWRTTRFISNDPCTKVKADGSYETFWLTGSTPLPAGTPLPDGNTGWRLPIQDEWGSIYRGGALTGSKEIALANTWKWYYSGGNTVSNGVKGYEIQPENATTTLFLPASGQRNGSNGNFYYAGNAGYYWSATISGINSLSLSINSTTVNPANSANRANGFAIRCIKN